MKGFPYFLLIRFLPRWLALALQVGWYYALVLALLFLASQVGGNFVYWNA